MKQWFKRFLCNHKYEVLHLEPDSATFQCSKCGKIKTIRV